MPNDWLGALWDAIREAGRPHGIVPAGSKALEMTRLEKAYRGGNELANDTSPVHTDQMRCVKLEMAFIGRDAVIRRAERGERSAIANLEIAPGDCDALGGEGVFLYGGLVGAVSSGGYRPVTGKSLAFAFVKPEPALDPQNLRLRDVAPAPVDA